MKMQYFFSSFNADLYNKSRQDVTTGFYTVRKKANLAYTYWQATVPRGLFHESPDKLTGLESCCYLHSR